MYHLAEIVRDGEVEGRAARHVGRVEGAGARAGGGARLVGAHVAVVARALQVAIHAAERVGAAHAGLALLARVDLAVAAARVAVAGVGPHCGEA